MNVLRSKEEEAPPATSSLRDDVAIGGNETTQDDYANRHIPSFLALPMIDLNDNDNQGGGGVVQVLRHGADLTADNFRRGHLRLDRPVLVTDRPESIGMTVPPAGFTVRNVAEKVGEAYPVHVLDVQLQTEIEGWTMGDLVEYFEDPRRRKQHHGKQKQQQQQQQNESVDEGTATTTATTETTTMSRRPRRAAALQSQVATSRLPVLNQLSLELSRTSMGPPFVQSPKFVRDMDWIDTCWPTAWRRRQYRYPMVQYYCLTSAAGAWTDFHIDFGGTSVWYHVLSGAKEFCLIAPTAANLHVYQEWMCSKHQEADFLPDKLCNSKDNVYKICLQAHQTLIIPSGWIHAVYTPVDSLVLGGNFLHGLAISRQLQAHTIELACRVPEETLFPYYRQLHVCAAGYYYAQMLLAPDGSLLVQQEREGIPALLVQVETWIYQDDGKSSKEEEQPTVQKVAQEMAQKHGFASFGALLHDFRQRLQQTDVSTAGTDASSSSPLPRQDDKATASRTPRIRLRTTRKPQLATTTTTKEEEEEEPLIQLSKPQRALPIPAQLVAARKRENVASFAVDHDDDEWIPTQKSSSSPPRKQQQQQRPNKRPKTTTSNRTTATASKNKMTAKSKTTTSSRNRLLKKLK